MYKPRHNEDQSLGFKLFKIGGLLGIVGTGSWLLFLWLGEVTLALGASIIAAIGGNILMVGILGDRRGEYDTSAQ
jgi:hypothetical protein